MPFTLDDAQRITEALADQDGLEFDSSFPAWDAPGGLEERMTRGYYGYDDHHDHSF